jgi:hypothetical protein
MRTLEELNFIQELISQGKNQSQISKETGIHRKVISKIVKEHFLEAYSKAKLFDPSKLTKEQEKAYSYILGQYLGDGHISLMRKKVYRLTISGDIKYHNIIQEVKDKLSIILPKNSPNLAFKKTQGKVNCVAIQVSSKKIKDMFPQHGKGPKHLRPIKLEPWQEDIVKAFPKDFLRGLIHSDGSRYVTKTTAKESTRYCFTNASTDIIALCCNVLQEMNIPYSLSKKAIRGMMKHHAYNVFIQKKSSVEFLETFIGPKT